MSLFSFFRKKKPKQIPPDASHCELAVDALGARLAHPNVQPEMCTAPKVSSLLSTREPINMKLVQGATDSKPRKPGVPKYLEPKLTSSVQQDLRGDITPNSEVTNMQYVHRAPLPTTTLSQVPTKKLYPVLSPISSQVHSPILEEKSKKVKELQSIHDIGEEICLRIQQEILDAIRIKNEFNRIEDDARKKVSAVENVIKNCSKLEYNFNKELNVAQNYSDVMVYKKLHTFNEVRSCHRRVNEPILLNMSSSRKAAPVFQSYRKKFRSYKGQKSDVIDCD